MEPGFSFLSLCYHKISYRVLITAIVTLDLFCTIYSFLDLDAYPDQYSFVNEDRLLLMTTRLQIVGGLSNLIVSIIWFHFNRDIICKVEVELNLLGANLVSDASVRKCSNEIIIVFPTAITVSFLSSIFKWTTWTQLTILISFTINSAFIYGCSGLLSCSLLQLGSFYDDFMRFNKYEDSVLRCQRIYTIFEKVCHLFKLPMFLIITWSFILCVCHLYVLFKPSLPGDFWNNLIFVMYTLYFQYPIVMVIRSCNELNKKAKTFNQQLYWEMVEDKSFKLLKNEKLNFHFLVNEEMIFTACGFFTIDNSLIFSMISTATTYLVIVLQYGRNDKPLVPSPTNTSLAILSSEQ
ncbi:Gustatory receptor 95a [Halyomorpha halys]|nr:Gustatory receptor 95a [Halyomorpha halys]